MSPATVLLIRSQHLGWPGLHVALEEDMHLSVVADLSCSRFAMDVAAKTRPSAILVGEDVTGISIVRLTKELRCSSPESQIVVVGEAVSQDNLIALGQLGIKGYLLWRNLDRTCLCHALASILDAGLYVANPAVIQALVSAPDRWPTPWRNEARFSKAERAVLETV